MKKLFLVLALVFTLLAIISAALPLDTLAFLPTGLAIAFCLLLLKKSDDDQKQLPKILLLLCVLASVFVLGKILVLKDEVVEDTQFEKQKTETNQEAKQELEDLEKDLE